jgi:hydroxypyruvate isomerase
MPTKSNRIRQSACRWCYQEIPIDALAREAAAIGLVGLDLVDPVDWNMLSKHGLVCTMTPSHGIEKGLNNRANHEQCLEKIRAAIDVTAEAGFANVICFSGNREPGISDKAGLENCEIALRKIVELAEQKKVTVCMELLNSKVNHPGYMCDRSEWGAELVKHVGSPRFKLLYDIYHMQVQEGDIIATIGRIGDRIGHYHTAGVPGRHELGEGQELFYPAIMRAIADSGFSGFVAHEFIATNEPVARLREAVAICDV